MSLFIIHGFVYSRCERDGQRRRLGGEGWAVKEGMMWREGGGDKGGMVRRMLGKEKEAREERGRDEGTGRAERRGEGRVARGR